jgi:hypothetical protein
MRSGEIPVLLEVRPGGHTTVAEELAASDLQRVVEQVGTALGGGRGLVEATGVDARAVGERAHGGDGTETARTHCAPIPAKSGC